MRSVLQTQGDSRPRSCPGVSPMPRRVMDVILAAVAMPAKHHYMQIHVCACVSHWSHESPAFRPPSLVHKGDPHDESGRRLACESPCSDQVESADITGRFSRKRGTTSRSSRVAHIWRRCNDG